jgi:hypothetical protein
LGVAGASMLFIGFFCPIFSIPVLGGISYLRGLEITMQSNSSFTVFHFAGLLVITASIASFIIVVTKLYSWLCTTGIAAGIAILMTLANYFDLKQTMNSGPSEMPNVLIEFTKAFVVQLGFGLAVVGVGTVLLFVAAFFPAKQRAN